MATRPGEGSVGKNILLKSNFFRISAFPRTISRYSFAIAPKIAHSSAIKKLLLLWLDLYFKNIGGSVALDLGSSSVYSSVDLPTDTLIWNLDLSDDIDDFANFINIQAKKTRTYQLTLKKLTSLTLQNLFDYLSLPSPDPKNFPKEESHALDVILRHRPSLLFTPIGRCFFSREGSSPISGGAELWQGYFQSLKPASGQMLLNIDLASTAFFEPGLVIETVAKILGKRSPDEIRQHLSERERNKILKSLKNVKVICTHRPSNRRRWKITGITEYPCDHMSFPFEGRDQNVVMYFRNRYNILLQYSHLPCLIVGDPVKHVYIPMELCKILPGQRILKRLNEKQTVMNTYTELIRFTCQSPETRSRKLIEGLNILQQPTVPNDFGVQLSTEMITVPARILPTPTLSYNASSKESTITPREGSWNLRDKKVALGAVLNAWSVIVFGHEKDIAPTIIAKFIRELALTCRETGIEIRNVNPPVRYGNPQGNIENIIKMAYMEAGNLTDSKPQMILCILPNAGVPLYAEIKRVSDTVVGIASQCVQIKHVFAAKKQYCANVALKLNVKLGGINAFLAPNQLPFITERPTIVFGADMTHPPTGDTQKPSIAACVASMDAQCSRYSAAIRIQKQRQEIILDLTGMVVELLRAFYQNTGSKPDRIVFYRDGVSESLFGELAEKEVGAIKAACGELEGGYNPTITYLVVQKRHHARFFPIRREDCDKSGNVLPGTVVDSVCTHPFEFDFYLASHPGLQGTSKPTHYHCLFDENQFSADGLQQLTYRLCYLYCRATKAVSVCPPAYYAHLVATRARYHFQGGEQWNDTESDEHFQEMQANFSGDTNEIAMAAEKMYLEKEFTDEQNGTGEVRLEPGEIVASGGGGLEKKEDDVVVVGKYGSVKPDLQNVMYFM
ncbi:hypothetical protein HK098_000874 [Nowakowskiella sp. JEL0407]|nr:hypothetical protein HK098_000874 [Nowakowskiella sp. JEL0407]